MAAVEQTTKYKAEAMSGDLLVVESMILEIKDKAIRFFHIMYNSETGIEVATSELVGVHIDKNERKACSIPEDIRDNCVALMSDAT